MERGDIAVDIDIECDVPPLTDLLEASPKR
jgi:hypothetical protein